MSSRSNQQVFSFGPDMPEPNNDRRNSMSGPQDNRQANARNGPGMGTRMDRDVSRGLSFRNMTGAGGGSSSMDRGGAGDYPYWNSRGIYFNIINKL